MIIKAGVGLPLERSIFPGDYNTDCHGCYLALRYTTVRPCPSKFVQCDPGYENVFFHSWSSR